MSNSEGTKNLPGRHSLMKSMWRYSLIIAMTLIIGYLASDIKEIQTKGDGKKLEEFTTDMVRLVKVRLTQTLSEILPNLITHKVLPVFEDDKKILGFVYRDDVFKLMSGIS